MKQEDVNDLVITLDKDMSIMAKSVTDVAAAVKTTNSKIDSIIDVIGTQNILAERLANISEKVNSIQLEHEGSGCRTATSNSESQKVANNRIDDLEKESIPKWVLKTAISILYGMLIMISTVMFTRQEGIMKKQQENIYKLKNHKLTQAIKYEKSIKRISTIERYQHRNYGFLQGSRLNTERK